MTLPVGTFHYPPGAPDNTLEGLERRLAAGRAAARYRNPETGQRHFCHNPLYRASFVRSTLALRQAVRALKAASKETP